MWTLTGTCTHTLTHRTALCSAQHCAPQRPAHSETGRCSETVPAFYVAAYWLQLWLTWGWEINVLVSSHLTQIYVLPSWKVTRAFNRHLEIPFLEYLSTDFYRNRKFVFCRKLFIFFHFFSLGLWYLGAGGEGGGSNIPEIFTQFLKKSSSRQNPHLDFLYL